VTNTEQVEFVKYAITEHKSKMTKFFEDSRQNWPTMAFDKWAAVFESNAPLWVLIDENEFDFSLETPLKETIDIFPFERIISSFCSACRIHRAALDECYQENKDFFHSAFMRDWFHKVKSANRIIWDLGENFEKTILGINGVDDATITNPKTNPKTNPS